MRHHSLVGILLLVILAWPILTLGQNSIDVEPNPPEAGSWVLDGPGFHVVGTWPQIFNDLATGEYLITWQGTEQWTPQCEPGYQFTLGPTDNIILSCQYDQNPQVRVDPVGCTPDWHLQNTSTGQVWNGSGTHDFFYVPFGNYTLTWDNFGNTYPDCGNPLQQDLNTPGQTWDAYCEFLATGTVTVDIDPDLPAANWTLHNSTYNMDDIGQGDAVLSNMPQGDYILYWGDVSCRETPATAQGDLSPGGSLTLSGTYIEDGTIIINVLPDGIGATWDLSLNSDVFSGTDDDTLSCMAPGSYHIVWNSLPDYMPPADEIRTLAAGDTITLVGTYTGLGTVVVDPRPSDNTTFSWELFNSEQSILSDWGYHSFLLPVDDYTLVWWHEDGWKEPIPNPMSGTLYCGSTLTFIGTYTPAPGIASITDVGNDQGRQVRLMWGRCVHDAPGDSLSITGYAVYRRQDANKDLTLPSPRRVVGDKLAGWDYLMTVPARGDNQYQCLAPTLCDSTANGICWSIFIVSALTADPCTFFDSNPDSGYSVDNLAPVQPQGLAVDYQQGGNDLSWQQNPESDVVSYRIYRVGMTGSDCPPPSGEPLAEVAAPSWHDPASGQWHVCYYVTAVDDAGNESIPTDWSRTGVSGISSLPSALALRANVPNPFNPATTIFYDLPAAVPVTLAVYDLSGRRIATLINKTQEAGHHHVLWQGRSDRGDMVASGVYCCRLRTPLGTLTRRMTLLK